jgi:hypothetical protein
MLIGFVGEMKPYFALEVAQRRLQKAYEDQMKAFRHSDRSMTMWE